MLYDMCSRSIAIYFIYEFTTERTGFWRVDYDVGLGSFFFWKQVFYLYNRQNNPNNKRSQKTDRFDCSNTKEKNGEL